MKTANEVAHVFYLVEERLNKLLLEKKITREEKNNVRVGTDQRPDGSQALVTVIGTSTDFIDEQVQDVYKTYLETRYP